MKGAFMADRQRVVHSIPPTFDSRSQVLVLGTMPSPASRSEGYNYGHPRNRFWKVLAALADEPLPTTNERKRDFCLRHHIALWDVLAECEIAGASDASIANAKPNRLTKITQSAPIEAVYCTGAKAYQLYQRLCEDEVGIQTVKLPSTSPANAACSMDRLMDAYAAILQHQQVGEPPVLDVADVVALEQAIAAAGTPLSELMDRAGTAVAYRIMQLLERKEDAAPAASGKRESPGLVVVLCGNGNNGGDGWVVARLLAQAGVPVCVFTARMPQELKAQPAHDAAVRALAELQEQGARVAKPEELVGNREMPVTAAADSADEAGVPYAFPLVVFDDGQTAYDGLLHQVIGQASVVVDALMGTGSSKAPRSPFDRWIVAANECAQPCIRLAVDVPSGVDAQTGRVEQVCFKADETVTMMVRKPGLTAAECGKVRVAPLAYLEPYLG